MDVIVVEPLMTNLCVIIYKRNLAEQKYYYVVDK